MSGVKVRSRRPNPESRVTRPPSPSPPSSVGRPKEPLVCPSNLLPSGPLPHTFKDVGQGFGSDTSLINTKKTFVGRVSGSSLVLTTCLKRTSPPDGRRLQSFLSDGTRRLWLSRTPRLSLPYNNEWDLVPVLHSRPETIFIR